MWLAGVATADVLLVEKQLLTWLLIDFSFFLNESS